MTEITLKNKNGWFWKKRALKIFDLCKVEALKKIASNFPVKVEFTRFSMGLTRNFHGIKGGPEIFWGLKESPFFSFFFTIELFCISPPNKCLWTVPKGTVQIYENLMARKHWFSPQNAKMFNLQTLWFTVCKLMPSMSPCQMMTWFA